MWKSFKTAGIISILTLAISIFFSSIDIDQNSIVGWIFPETVMLKNFDFTDVIFAHQLKEDLGTDSNIVLVNIGNLDRKGIAEQIEIINAQNPKVIGLDCNFRILKDRHDDSLLALALSSTRRLVLYSKLDLSSNNKGVFDTVALCHPYFAKYGKSGYCNLNLSFSQQYAVQRSFRPVFKIGDEIHKSFAFQLAFLSDSLKAKMLLDRGNELELINYRGNRYGFYSMDVKDIMALKNPIYNANNKGHTAILKDKIILMGFMGNDLERDFNMNIEDKYYTPLNQNYLDKSAPDMFGLVVHANIISTILHRNYLNVSSQAVKVITSFLLCLLHVWILLLVFYRIPEWFDLLSILLLIFQVVLFSVLRITLFVKFNYKMDFDLTIGSLAVASIIVSVYHISAWGKFFNRVLSRKKLQKPLI